jgi:hypothetical protein
MRLKSRQAVLLVGGLAEVVYGATQAAERAGDGQGQQQADGGQHHQGDGQGTERPEQALAVPGHHLRVGNAVDEQVGLARGRAAVFLGDAAPGQAFGIVVASLEGRRARREGAVDQGLAFFVEDLDVHPVALLALLQKLLGGFRAIALVELAPQFGDILQRRMAAEYPGVLVQRPAQQHGQAGDQGDGQPEAGEDAPEQ